MKIEGLILFYFFTDLNHHIPKAFDWISTMISKRIAKVVDSIWFKHEYHYGQSKFPQF